MVLHIIISNRWTLTIVLKYNCLDLLVYALPNAHVRINRIYQYADYSLIENICAHAVAVFRMKLHNPQPHAQL